MRSLSRSVLVLLSCTLAAACGHHEAAKPPAAPPIVALVYSGWELFMGNDDVVPVEDPSLYPGVLKALAAGLDKADLAHAMPAGSQGLIVTYADKPILRVPLTPVANLTGVVLGTQKDYFRTTGNELVRGLVLAVDALEKAPAGPKYLVVVSDGNDTNNEQAKAQLAALKQRVAKLGIAVTSLIYKTQLSGPDNVVTAFAESTTAASADALQADLAHALGHLGAKP
jgi:hypothetical protein